MKIIMWIILGVILGICVAVVLIANDVFKSDKDPYDFLNPKFGHKAIEVPFKDIDKKDAKVSTYFWYVPKEEPKLFNLVPFGSWEYSIYLSTILPETDNSDLDFYFYYFKKNNPNKHALFLVELFKINNDLTKTLIFKKELDDLRFTRLKKYKTNQRKVEYYVESFEHDYDYGQYQVVITSLLDMPHLTDNGKIPFFLRLSIGYRK